MVVSTITSRRPQPFLTRFAEGEGKSLEPAEIGFQRPVRQSPRVRIENQDPVLHRTAGCERSDAARSSCYRAMSTGMPMDGSDAGRGRVSGRFAASGSGQST